MLFPRLGLHERGVNNPLNDDGNGPALSELELKYGLLYKLKPEERFAANRAWSKGGEIVLPKPSVAGVERRISKKSPPSSAFRA